MNRFLFFPWMIRLPLIPRFFWLGGWMMLPIALAGAQGYPLLKPADVNADGYSDLVFYDGSGPVVILINQKDGTFTAASQFFPQGTPVREIRPVPVTSRTSADLLLFYPEYAAMEWRKNADYAVMEPVVQSPGAGAEAIAAGFSTQAAVAMGFSGSRTIAVLERAVQGWDVLPTLAADDPVWDLQFIDLDQDASDELLALCGAEQQTMKIYKRTSRFLRGEWSLDRHIGLHGSGYRRFHAGHWNEDAQLDLFLWNAETGQLVLTLLGAPRLQSERLPAVNQIAPADLNGDHLLDLLILSPNPVSLTWLRNSGGRFSSIVIRTELPEIQKFTTGYFTQTAQLEVFLLGKNAEGFPYAILSGFDTGKFQTLSQGRLQVSEALSGGENENVLIIKTEDWVNGEPYIYRSFHVPGWTTGIASLAADLSQMFVKRERFSETGLTAASDQAIPLSGLGEDLSQYVVQFNQIAPDCSHLSLHPPRFYSPLALDIAPPGGEYQRAITVEPIADEAAQIFYRIGSEAWRPCHEPIVLWEDTAISFYAQAQIQKQFLYSPVLHRSYRFPGGPSQDSDGDGIPDRLESAFQLPVLSRTFDYDGDTWNDLEELIRESNPLDKNSVPKDRDSIPSHTFPNRKILGDGWSDFDETTRRTDPADPLSFPAAPSLDVAEYKLTLNLGASLQTLPFPFSLSQGSVLSVDHLTGDRVLRTEYENHPWRFRLPGHQPLIVRARERSNPSLVLLDYSPSHVPYWNPAREYDGRQTPAEWLAKLRQKITAEFYLERSQTIDLETTAAVLAFQFWMIREWHENQPAQWGGQVKFPRPDPLRELQRRYDLDAVYAHIQNGLRATSWPVIVHKAFVWAQANPYPDSVDTVLHHLLLRQPVPDRRLPPDITEAAADQAIQDLAALFSTVPDLVIDAVGTLAWQDRQVLFTPSTGGTSIVLAEGWNFTPGAAVHLKGTIQRQSQQAGWPRIRVESLALLDEESPWIWSDRDEDGLPDDWEDYYFAYTGADPRHDPDADGRTNRQEYEERTHPYEPRGWLPRPTPTPTTTPAPSPTQQPVPSPFPKSPLEVTRRFDFEQDSLAGEGFTPVPGGFQGWSPGRVHIGENTESGLSSDFRKGAFLQCGPGEVMLLVSQPVLVGKNPVFVRITVKAGSPFGQFAIAVLDGDYNGSIATWIPANTRHLEATMHQITCLYEPVNSDTIVIVVQLFTPGDVQQTVEMYIDNIEILPFEGGIPIAGRNLGITPLTSRGDGWFQPAPTGTTPTPAAEYTFDQATLAEAQCLEYPGGFSPYPGGESVLGGIPSGLNDAISNGRGLIFTCDPGENQLILGYPPVEAGPYPVLLKCMVQTTSPEGQLALAALDGSHSGSIATFIPSDTAFMTGQYQPVCLVFQPTDTTTVSPVLQLYVPPTARGRVTAYVDNLQIIPIRPTDRLEAQWVSRRSPNPD